MGELQIEELAKTRIYTESIRITAPSAGFILSRNISPGQRFDKGYEWYRLADLSRIWILTDTYEKEAKYLPPGKIVTVSHPGIGKTLQARVSETLPQFDAASRTLNVRLETENPEYLLKPDMFVDVEIPVTLAAAITVPGDAILHSGRKKTVFVDRGKGFFEPREVKTGLHLGGQVEIVEGPGARRADRALRQLPDRLGKQAVPGGLGDAAAARKGPGLRPGGVPAQGGEAGPQGDVPRAELLLLLR